jgi:hypothetical protein
MLLIKAKMNYTIDIDHDLRIIRYKHSGSIKSKEIAEAWQSFLSMKEFTDLKYNLLSDYRGAKLNMDIKSPDLIVDFMMTIEPIVRGKKQSLILDDPYSTAGSVLFGERVYKKVGFKVKVFSTEKAALEWISS